VAIGSGEKQLNQKDSLELADCVEAHVVGLQVPEQTKVVSIVLRLVGGRTAILTAEGVDRFLVNELREQNIIDRINVWDKGSSQEEFQQRLAELIGADRDSASVFSSLVASETHRIAKGERVLVEIEPVYGAWFLMLARSVSLQAMRP
jgi:hypothetical protein